MQGVWLVRNEDRMVGPVEVLTVLSDGCVKKVV